MFSTKVVPISTEIFEPLWIIHTFLNNKTRHDATRFFAKNEIILYCPFFKSRNCGVITSASSNFGLTALKYSLDARLTSTRLPLVLRCLFNV
ncbi:MAG: hypothetical protein CM15mP74_13000 [Halieaceae bacterium]|nr:MAG: hypothetical protein CM15mP74_13000 [Halieaceae bacterium]